MIWAHIYSVALFIAGATCRGRGGRRAAIWWVVLLAPFWVGMILDWFDGRFP